MSEFLARLAMLVAGLWDGLGARIAEARWTFAAGGAWTLGIGLVLAALLALACYWRTREGLTLGSRLTLSTLRFTALAALLLIIGGTVCNIDLVRSEHPRLLVLVDDSPSMLLPHGATTRWAAAQESIAGLAARGDFAVQVTRTSGRAEGEPVADGAPQDLATAIVRTVSAAGAWGADHILLISDGVQGDGSGLERIADEVPAPVSSLGFAAVADHKDAVLGQVVVPAFVYQSDRVVITAEVRAQGVVGDVRLNLVHLVGGAEKDTAEATITLGASAAPAMARLEFRAPTEAGLHRYALRLTPPAGDTNERNNRLVFHLDVRGERIRLLFVEGEPSWEYRYAKQAFAADPAIEFTGLVRLPDQEWVLQTSAVRPDGKPVLKSPKDGFPASSEELDYFDVIILGDLERKIFERDGRFDLVDAFVRQQGGGLATIGGFKVYGAGDYHDTALARLLPFSLGREKKAQLVNRFNVQITPQGLMHPLMALEGDPRANDKVWAGMPWVEGGNALAAVRPGATLLMTHPTQRSPFGPRPIAAAWPCGRGRVFSTALDGTWHWRLGRTTEIDYHQRYWGLVARWLGGDPRSARSIGSLIAEQAVMEVGAPATFSLSVRSAEGAARLDAVVAFTVHTPGGETVTAHAIVDPALPGRYSMTYVPRQAGEHRVAVAITEVDGVKNQELAVLVSPSRQEYLDVRPHPAALAALATASGGVATTIGEADAPRLPAAGTRFQAQAVVVDLWRAPGLLALLVICLCLEWFLRKRRGLA